ncbi:MAG TPA: hypothetical protein VMZ53_27565, partial [Kofleriaceae bacterium]|nr:hypothetical protein [Kofleriaceae bacterium]
MRPIDWLLAHLDEPGVAEIVIGVGRPVAVRGAEGFRAVTSMNFERNDIETLVAGTPMSGLIGSPTSLPPAELQLDARRLVVEVVRQGYNAALRIALVGAPPVDAEPRPASTTSAPRTATPTSAPRTTTPTSAPSRTSTPTSAPHAATPTSTPDPMTSYAPPRTSTPTSAPDTMTSYAAPRTSTPTAAPSRTSTPTAAP